MRPSASFSSSPSDHGSRLASTRFPRCTLPADDAARYSALSNDLLRRAVAECETTLSDIDGRWKHTRTHGGSLKIYKSSQGSSQLMATGIISGTLHDVMTCMYADENVDFRMKSALLMPKEHLDCEVLRAIETTHRGKGGRFVGLKWAATKWPALSKHRDMCYLEATGITQSTDRHGLPLEYGYSLLESVDLPHQCPPLDEFSIVRAKISVRHIFRELPIGCTLVMTHCSVDVGGALWLSDASSLPHLTAVARMAECAESIRLSLALQARYPNHMPWPDQGGRRLSFLSKKKAIHCAICGDHGGHLERKRVIQALGCGIKAMQLYFCADCTAPPPPPPSPTPSSLFPTTDVDVDFLDELVRFSSVETASFSTLRSSTLSDDRQSTMMAPSTAAAAPPPSTLPILDFDDDDDDEAMYGGLDNTIPAIVHYEGSSSAGSCATSGTDLSSSMQSPSSIALQLMHLNLQMKDTMDVLRRNQSHADLLRRDLDGCHA
ncbi:Aste57867_15919 [Aphanomyces stellatus]|uniref:Aste57867_15919 protein n=1 Tax=Aphanomyces stellatus TaxID=120398 RepID=A0A485L577_9STRA|nr:hypothetical protein As57867_015863 [Aphanomyces stellatus]VFT92705.1 Aste57867_15919 [Aphanomyces stellatus]